MEGKEVWAGEQSDLRERIKRGKEPREKKSMLSSLACVAYAKQARECDCKSSPSHTEEGSLLKYEGPRVRSRNG